MKQFIVKCCKVGFLFYLLLWLIQIVIDTGLRQSEDDTYYNWNKLYNGEINADILFLGSSRTLKHYNPQIFDEKLNVYSYNLGSNGSAFDIQKIKRNAYLRNNSKPELIVLNVDIGSLSKSSEIYNKKQFLPYYSLKNYKDMSNIDASVFYEYLFPMSKYRENFDLISLSVKSLIGIEEKNLNTIKGFSGSNQKWNNSFENRLKELNGKKFDYSKFNYKERLSFFETEVLDINQSKIPLLLVWAPEYVGRQYLESDILDKTIRDVKNVANKYDGVEFIDFTKDSICYDTYYFYNSYHLNKIGATKFSNMVSDSINKYFKKVKKSD